MDLHRLWGFFRTKFALRYVPWLEAPLVTAIRDLVAQSIGPFAKPRQIILTPDLPKTRSGKIMRRLLRDVAEHRELGDVTTLTDPAVVSLIDELMAVHASDDE